MNQLVRGVKLFGVILLMGVIWIGCTIWYLNALRRITFHKDATLPTYTFKNTKTGKTKDVFLAMSEREIWLSANPDYVQTHSGSSALIGTNPQTAHKRKPSEGFREVLRTIKKKHPRSNINTF